MIKPINPNDLSDNQYIPDEIITIVNNLVRENWDGKASVVYQNKIVKAYLKLSTSIVKTEDDLIDRGFLNFEKIYEDAGWNVKYESPSRDEDFNSYFKFTKK